MSLLILPNIQNSTDLTVSTDTDFISYKVSYYIHLESNQGKPTDKMKLKEDRRVILLCPPGLISPFLFLSLSFSPLLKYLFPQPFCKSTMTSPSGNNQAFPPLACFIFLHKTYHYQHVFVTVCFLPR